MTNEEAFKKVCERLENDAGEIIKLVIKERQKKDWCPWWALVRILLPVAEAIGDLLYQETPSKNLTRVLREDLNKYNENYSRVAVLIILLYRHSLMHQDELRAIQSKNTQVKWKLSFGEQGNHLKIEQDPKEAQVLWVQFDTTQFYQDLVQVCREKSKNPNTEAAQRYSKWLTLDLDNPSRKSKKLFLEAQQEIADVTKELQRLQTVS